MRFRKRWLFLLLVLLAALPGFPPAIEWGLKRALADVPGNVEWQSVSGYALTGLKLTGVKASGPGYRAELGELRVDYNLLALAGGKLPLNLELKDGHVFIDPERLDFGGGSGGGAAKVEPVLQKLALENVQIESAAWPRFVLPAYRLEIDGELPDFDWQLQTADGRLNGHLKLKSLDDWRTSFAGDVAVSRFWWDGQQSGRLEGGFGYQQGHWRGSAELSGGRVVLAGFPINDVSGTISYDDHVIITSLLGQSLGGPVQGEGVVDIPAAHYQFSASGEPQLAELLKLWKVNLPASGSGPLKITGSGWEELDLKGEFSGEGWFLQRLLSYEGGFRFTGGRFTLSTTAAGSFLERDWSGRFDWQDGGWTSTVTDDKGSRIEARGAGVRYQGGGRLVWPYPLKGAALVKFSGEGTRWRVDADSPNVGLLLVKEPLDLSGYLAGEGMDVSGRLGPVGFSGRWEDLQMELDPVALLVGEVSGRAVWKERFSFDGAYSSPYTEFPLHVEQEGAEWRGRLGGYGGFVWRDGVFDAQVKGLPIEYYDQLTLSGNARWTPQAGWSGRQRLVGRYLALNGRLAGSEVKFDGLVDTPLGKLPLNGVADAAGLRGRLDEADYSYAGGRFSLDGRVTLDWLIYEGELAWRAGRWQGAARLQTPWVEGRLRGDGDLYAETSGWLTGSGVVLPKPSFNGELRLPELAGLRAAPLPVRIEGERAEVGDGFVELRAPYRFSVRLPLSYQGYNGELVAGGDIQVGDLTFRTPWGKVAASGPWGEMGLGGSLQLPRLGRAELAGKADLFKRRYRLVADLPDSAGKVEVEGEDSEYDWSLSLQGQALSGQGRGRNLKLLFDGFDSTFLGLPGEWRGELAYESGLRGDLVYSGPYGEVRARGYGTLRLQGGGSGYKVGGYFDDRGLHASIGLELPGLAGQLQLEGPWLAARATGEGVWRFPGAEPQPWLLTADLKSRRWAVSGPLSVEGSGLRYQGRIDWNEPVYGKDLSLRGSFEGNGPRLAGKAGLDLAGFTARMSFSHEADWSVAAQSPAGDAEYAAGKLRLRLRELEPLGRALGLPFGGSLAGELDVRRPAGSLTGTLRLAGESLGLVVRPGEEGWLINAYDGQHGVGLQAGLGGVPYLAGLGAVEGKITFGRDWNGGLRYVQNGLDLGLRAVGKRLTASIVTRGETVAATYSEGVLAAEFSGYLNGEGELRADDWSYRLRARYGSEYAEAYVSINGLGPVWHGSGFLVSYQGLPQAGPLSLEGNGLDWFLSWAAPLALQMGGHGLDPDLVRLYGASRLGDATGVWGWARSDLEYRDGSYTGELLADGDGWKLRLTGEGERAVVGGDLFGFDLSGHLDAGGRMKLRLGGERDLGSSRLEVSGAVGGRLFAPHARVFYRLESKQEGEILGQFVYDHGWVFTLGGPGINVYAEDGSATIDAQEFELAPFSGLPLKLDASGAGPLASLRLQLHLYDDSGKTDLSGWLQPLGLKAELQGAVLGGEVRLQGGSGRWSLRLDHPWAKGQVEYQSGNWSGGFDVDLPLKGGGLRGRLDAAARRLRLAGYGDYQGELEAGLDPLGLRGSLRGPGFALESNLVRLTGGNWVGDLNLDLPGWGGARLTGIGDGLRLSGGGGLEPLRGFVGQNPWRLNWSYRGDLPRSLGWLDAAGELPGRWLQGVWKYGGLEWRLAGSGGELLALTEGARMLARTAGLEAELSGLQLAGLSLSGSVNGSWNDLNIDLRGGGLHLRGIWGSKTELDFSGWLTGKVFRDESGWRGGLTMSDGRLTVSGKGPLPELRGSWRGRQLSFVYPKLSVDALSLDLKERRAEGELKLDELRLIGEGGVLTAVYPLPDGRLTAALDLETLKLLVDPDGAGEGTLVYQPKEGFSGEMELTAPWGKVAASGDGGLRASWKHPATDWLPWGVGELSFELENGWRLRYTGDDSFNLVLENAPEGLRLRLVSDWGGGELVYEDGWHGSVEVTGFPLALLEAGLDAELTAEAGALAASGELSGRAGRLSYSLRADAAGLLPRLENAALVVEKMRLEKLPAFLNKLPYASGSVSATFAYGNGMLAGRLVSDGLTVAGETYPVEAALYWSGERKTLEASVGDSNITGEWKGDDVYLTADLVRLPLHFLTGAWSGPLDGVGYWTGAARAHLHLDDLRKSYVVAVGERLEFTGGGDSLTGSAVARYENGVFYLDDLKLSGKGSWRGSGYWGPDDADLTVEIENTVFTPVLGVFPQLRRLKPSAAGSLSLRARGRSAVLKVDGLHFTLAAIDGEVQSLLLKADGGRLQVDGRVLLEKPYPGGFEISGSGDRDDLGLELGGEIELPAVGHLQGIKGSLHWPDWKLDLKAKDAHLSGRLWPLRLWLTGELPVSLPDKYLQSGLVRSDLSLVYRNGEYLLGGEAEVVRAVLSRPEGRREVAFKEKKYTYPLRFDRVRIFSNGGIIVQEPLAKGEGEGEVYLGGDLADPYLSGEVRAVRGDFLLGRHRFLVDEGWARFTPVGGLYPDIYLLAHSEVRQEEGELLLYLETDGRFVREKGRARLVLQPRIWALENGEPAPYTQEQLLAMLALGGGGNLAQGAADLAIQNLLIAQLEYELSKALGLDIFTLDTEIFGGGGVENTQFTIGKYLGPDLLLTYSINLQGQQAVGAEYRIDGLRLRVESELGGELLEPQVRFSLLYAIRPDLDLILKLQTGAMYLGLEWRF